MLWLWCRPASTADSTPSLGTSICQACGPRKGKKKAVWSFLRKLNIEMPYDPAILFLGIYPEKTIIQKDTCTPVFIAALFTITKTWKQPRYLSPDEWIKKVL